LWVADFSTYIYAIHPQVMERCFASVIPKENFLDVMGGSPDLYGKDTSAFSGQSTNNQHTWKKS
jgi:hypothetical protein